MIGKKEDRSQGLGSTLVQSVIRDAREGGYLGVAVFTSKGAWLADKSLFVHNGFTEVGKKGRFELLAFKVGECPDPEFANWEENLSAYDGWHLVYADQCPWHPKSVEAITRTAKEFEIDLQVTRLESPEEIRTAPTGFGVFGLIRDGRILEDHYISETRFRNILRKELQ